MAYNDDDEQDKLSQLLVGKIGRGTMGLYDDPGTSTDSPNAATPAAAPPSPALASRVSDDPNVTGLPAQPQAPATPSNDVYQRMLALNQKIAANPEPKYEDYKPKWYDRVLGGVIGGLARDPQPGIDITNRTYNSAVSKRSGIVNPLYEQLKNEQALVPFEQQHDTDVQRTFENQGKVYDRALRTRTESNTVRETTPEVRTDAQGNDHFYKTTLSGHEYEVPAPTGYMSSQDRQTKMQNTAATGASPESYLDPVTKRPSLRIKTQAGGYMPYTPTKVEEGAMLGDPRATALFNRQHPGKDGAKEKSVRDKQNANDIERNQGFQEAQQEYENAMKSMDTRLATRKLKNPDAKEGAEDAADRQLAFEKLTAKKQKAQNKWESNAAKTGAAPASHVQFSPDKDTQFKQGKTQEEGGDEIPQPVVSPALDQRKPSAGKAQPKIVSEADIRTKTADRQKAYDALTPEKQKGQTRPTYDVVRKAFESVGYTVK